MKMAVVHEWFIDWAGSERVVQQILACYPHADLFALVDFLPPEHRSKILGKRVGTTFLQRLPFARSRHAYYLPWMPIAIEQLDLSAYDVVISSSHAVAKGVLTGPDQLHISYVHSPMRYAWDLQGEYLRGKNGSGLRGFFLRWVLHYLRQWDLRTANGVDAFVANSEFVARRIRKVYRRESTVIYPPVDVDAFPLHEHKQDFYLCAGRLESYKRTDVAVRAFAGMPTKRLVVLGDGPEFATLKKIASSNVRFVGYQSQELWLRYLQSAKALIFPGVEDFGITPVEAQACGTPVIGFGQGGLLETVIPLGQGDCTGILFSEQSPDSIVAAVELFEGSSGVFDPHACRRNAERFTHAKFREAFRAFVEARLAAKRQTEPHWVPRRP